MRESDKPVALVYGWGHWVVVRGFEASAAPTDAGDTSFTITSFDLNNPWPPLPTSIIPPHGGADGCGTGGVRGIADENIAYPAWQSTYMTGVPSGYWKGKFVAVCDPDPPALVVGKQRPTPPRRSGEQLLTPKEAADHALAGLREYHLLDRDSWKKSLAKTVPAEPILVQRLDRLDTFYYLVPMQAGRKAVRALVCVDGRFGDYLQAVCLPEGGKGGHGELNFSAKEALDKVLGKRIELPQRQGQLLVRKEAACLAPTLVWKPCRESLSPYYPFFMITVGRHRVYVRVDGNVFTELHDQDAGI